MIDLNIYEAHVNHIYIVNMGIFVGLYLRDY